MVTTSTTIPFIFLLILLLCHSMVRNSVQGLPIFGRQERDSGDLIVGQDFLSFLLAPSRQQQSASRYDSYSAEGISLEEEEEEKEEAMRIPRQDSYNRIDYDDSTRTNHSQSSEPEPDLSNKAKDEGTIISVRVSSSVGHSKINKQVSGAKGVEAEGPVTYLYDDRFEAVPSEEPPDMVAEASKSDFSVDEGEPISLPYDPSRNLRETIIYHNSPNNNKARSVSYSTVIQALPNAAPEKSWNNHVNVEESNRSQNQSSAKILPPQNHADYHVDEETANSGFYVSPPPQMLPAESTQRSWAPEPANKPAYLKSRPYTPIVYAQPEQNYEVDEAISVETNGRTHGVQAAHNGQQQQQKSGKKDDNQKVGYVVEGRNYRKYRVEERTSDGFIVGEYGVVRHDDGSLRGVRYTADGTISPRLIYDALMKFLSL